MATHYSILAWKIPRKEEPGRLQFTGSANCQTLKRVGQDLVNKTTITGSLSIKVDKSHLCIFLLLIIQKQWLKKIFYSIE